VRPLTRARVRGVDAREFACAVDGHPAHSNNPRHAGNGGVGGPEAVQCFAALASVLRAGGRPCLLVLVLAFFRRARSSRSSASAPTDDQCAVLANPTFATRGQESQNGSVFCGRVSQGRHHSAGCHFAIGTSSEEILGGGWPGKLTFSC
jgi:hypothetical protein